MRLQALRKVGVELQSNSEDADVTRHDCEGYDAQTRVGTKAGVHEQDEEGNDDSVKEEEEVDEKFTEPKDEQKDVGPVDDMIADDSTTHVDRIDDRVKNTGLRTARSLVNGGLAILALGALSPVGLLLNHLDGLKDQEQNIEGEERTEDINDL